jgi:hypothetical protein
MRCGLGMNQKIEWRKLTTMNLSWVYGATVRHYMYHVKGVQFHTDQSTPAAHNFFFCGIYLSVASIWRQDQRRRQIIHRSNGVFKNIYLVGGLLKWRRFQASDVSGQRIGPIFTGQESESDFWPVRMAPIRCPETSVNNYHMTPRNTAEDCRFHQHRGGSLKSKFIVCIKGEYVKVLSISLPFRRSHQTLQMWEILWIYCVHWASNLDSLIDVNTRWSIPCLHP